MISLLVTLIVIALIVYVVQLIIAQLALPATIKNIIYAVMGLIVLLYLLDLFGLYHFAAR